ncbi:MAG TPA: hypothetical protein VKB47_08595 [Terracidiphilus sp.]|nr:hypothetical protein [Terracidiphilus sp.]
MLKGLVRILARPPQRQPKPAELSADNALANLVLRANILAEFQIRFIRGSLFCSECRRPQPEGWGQGLDKKSFHYPNCRAGQVLEAIELLEQMQMGGRR